MVFGIQLKGWNKKNRIFIPFRGHRISVLLCDGFFNGAALLFIERKNSKILSQVSTYFPFTAKYFNSSACGFPCYGTLFAGDPDRCGQIRNHFTGMHLNLFLDSVPVLLDIYSRM